jgi:hypothetical protein
MSEFWWQFLKQYINNSINLIYGMHLVQQRIQAKAEE